MPKFKVQIVSVLSDGYTTDVEVAVKNGNDQWREFFKYHTDDVITMQRLKNDLSKRLIDNLKLKTPDLELNRHLGKEFDLDL
jgi:hypothetical protein